MLSYQVEAFGRPLAQVLRATPTPQGSEVLVSVGSCGVCHSDVHLHDGYFDLGGETKLDMTRSMKPPRTLGHEIAGVVVALGPDAKGVELGAPCVVYPWIGCGACSLCQQGQEHLCGAPQALGTHRDGGFADHVLVPHPRYLLDHGSLAQEQACTYACAGLTAYSALKKVGPLGANDPLVIIGAGGVGLSAIRLTREVCGVAPIVVELDTGKWDLAREAGARELVDPRSDGALRALLKASGGAAAVVDFVGNGASFTTGFNALRKGGKLVCVGLMGGAASIGPAMVAMKAVSVVGSYVGSLAEMQELMAIARTGALPDMPLSTQDLANATAALDALRAGHVRGRIVLKPAAA
jgi:D-arabinose 1-dehydrogenase-like Zn-dependent alcohol dehydrogenase